MAQLTAAMAARSGLPVVSAPPPNPPARAAVRPSTTASPATSSTDTAPTARSDGAKAAPAPTVPAWAAVEAASVGGCADLADNLEGDMVGLSATYWLNVDDDLPPPNSVTVRFVGRRVGAEDSSDPRDRFDRTEQVDGLLRGCGRVSITIQVQGINHGQWQVAAARLPDGPARTGELAWPRDPVQWQAARTGLAPLLHGPGVRQAAWPILVLLGVLVALTTQAALMQRSIGSWAAGLAVSVAAVLVGYLAAKAWYLVLHRQSLRRFIHAGTCIQGFLVGAFGALAVAALLTGPPVGLLLDASTPAVFFAMALGRPGCFLGGCCAGRPTVSRWGLWSSDRRIGMRRIPVQLLEAAMVLVIGIGTLALFLAGPLPLSGALFVGAVAFYTLGRQLLFPLRHERRRTATGRLLTLAAAALAAVVVMLAVVLAG